MKMRTTQKYCITLWSRWRSPSGTKMSWVRRVAGVLTKTAPTRIMRMTVKPRMNCFMPLPRYLPWISGSEAPSWRMEMKPAMKSWTAPAKMQPKTIQRKEAVPNWAPMMAPMMGPTPAMLRNWMRKMRQGFMGTKSTPSGCSTAGVVREGSTPMTRSMSLEYSQ